MSFKIFEFIEETVKR